MSSQMNQAQKKNVTKRSDSDKLNLKKLQKYVQMFDDFTNELVKFTNAPAMIEDAWRVLEDYECKKSLPSFEKKKGILRKAKTLFKCESEKICKPLSQYPNLWYISAGTEEKVDIIVESLEKFNPDYDWRDDVEYEEDEDSSEEQPITDEEPKGEINANNPTEEKYIERYCFMFEDFAEVMNGFIKMRDHLRMALSDSEDQKEEKETSDTRQSLKQSLNIFNAECEDLCVVMSQLPCLKKHTKALKSTVKCLDRYVEQSRYPMLKSSEKKFTFHEFNFEIDPSTPLGITYSVEDEDSLFKHKVYEIEIGSVLDLATNSGIHSEDEIITLNGQYMKTVDFDGTDEIYQNAISSGFIKLGIVRRTTSAKMEQTKQEKQCLEINEVAADECETDQKNGVQEAGCPAFFKEYQIQVEAGERLGFFYELIKNKYSNTYVIHELEQGGNLDKTVESHLVLKKELISVNGVFLKNMELGQFLDFVKQQCAIGGIITLGILSDSEVVQPAYTSYFAEKMSEPSGIPPANLNDQGINRKMEEIVSEAVQEVEKVLDVTQEDLDKDVLSNAEIDADDEGFDEKSGNIIVKEDNEQQLEVIVEQSEAPKPNVAGNINTAVASPDTEDELTWIKILAIIALLINIVVILFQ